ncbi:hypothetical protein BGZ95_007826, partial [Linnemannia exigua]
MARGWIREVGRYFQLSLAVAPLGCLYDARPEGYQDPNVEGWGDKPEYEEYEEEGENT